MEIRVDGDIAAIPTVIAGDVNGDGIEDVFFGNQSLSIQTDEVTSAVVAATSAFEYLPQYPSTLQVSLNGISDSFAVVAEGSRGQTITPQQVIEAINAKLMEGPLARKATASLTALDRIFISTDKGGSDIELSVSENVTGKPLGYLQPRTVSSMKGN